MKRIIMLISFVILLISIITILTSCSRAVTVQQAANNHYRGCRPVK
ncbi:MAG: hypothetical protein ABIY51_13310 [Ferruginibacter sp.]